MYEQIRESNGVTGSCNWTEPPKNFHPYNQERVLFRDDFVLVKLIKMLRVQVLVLRNNMIILFFVWFYHPKLVYHCIVSDRLYEADMWIRVIWASVTVGHLFRPSDLISLMADTE